MLKTAFVRENDFIYLVFMRYHLSTDNIAEHNLISIKINFKFTLRTAWFRINHQVSHVEGYPYIYPR